MGSVAAASLVPGPAARRTQLARPLCLTSTAMFVVICDHQARAIAWRCSGLSSTARPAPPRLPGLQGGAGRGRAGPRLTAVFSLAAYQLCVLRRALLPYFPSCRGAAAARGSCTVAQQ